MLLKVIILNIEDMMRIFVTLIIIGAVVSDCPFNPYPRKTVTGIVEAQLNNDPNMHGRKLNFEQQVDLDLSDSSPRGAVGLHGFQLNSNQMIDFSINYVPKTIPKKLAFTLEVDNNNNGWRSIKFNYFVTASADIQILNLAINDFSMGLTPQKFSIYRAIPNFDKFQPDPVVRVYISGMKLKAKPLGNQYSLVTAQYQKFKTFSTNTQLINYFKQIVEQSKSLSFDITSVKILGRILTLNFQTNCQIRSLQFSYILFSQQNINKKHNYIVGDLEIINNGEYKFTPLQNMDMMFVGVNQFKVPRDSTSSVSLNFNNFMGQATLNVNTNIPYFAVGYTFLAFDMKQQFVCEDCTKSPYNFENRFCVEQCPRGYSQSKRLDSLYCDICSIDKLKIIDPVSSTCVCASRHFLDSTQDTCKPCRYDCMSCDSGSRCLTCDNSLLQTKRKLSSNGKCQCPPDYFDDSKAQNIVCQKCSPKCLTCNGPRDFDCLTCAAGKQLDARGFCVCRNGFNQDPRGNCVCVPPRIFSSGICFESQAVCGPNQVQQFVDLTKRCVCQSGSQQVLNQCIKCGPNSVFSPQDLICKCVNNTVKINNQCVPCDNNTVYDSTTGTCTCISGTFRANDGSCIVCGPKMAYINGNCECIFNYFQIKPGVCQRCLRETDGVKCIKNVR